MLLVHSKNPSKKPVPAILWSDFDYYNAGSDHRTARRWLVWLPRRNRSCLPDSRPETRQSKSKTATC